MFIIEDAMCSFSCRLASFLLIGGKKNSSQIIKSEQFRFLDVKINKLLLAQFKNKLKVIFRISFGKKILYLAALQFKGTLCKRNQNQNGMSFDILHTHQFSSYTFSFLSPLEHFMNDKSFFQILSVETKSFFKYGIESLFLCSASVDEHNYIFDKYYLNKFNFSFKHLSFSFLVKCNYLRLPNIC